MIALTKYRVFALLMACLLLAAACGGGGEGTTSQEDNGAPADQETAEGEQAADGEARAGGTLRVGLHRDPIGMDPHINYGATTPPLQGNIYESLVFYDEDGNITPWLAESWETDDFKTWTFTLREGVTFHNGSTFDSEDVLYSFERILEPDTGATRAAEIAAVESMEALSANQVQLTLEEPDSTFPIILSTPELAMIDKEWAEDGGDFSSEMMGTGPFKLDSHEREVSYELSRHDDYWDSERPHLDAVVYRIIEDHSARVTALKSGEIDLAEFIPWQNIAEFDQDDAYDQTVTYDSFNTIRVNVNEPPVDDPLVRQALNYAIDRQAIMDVGFGGMGVPQTVAFINPESDWYNEDLDGHWSYDPDRARELLAEAGYDDPSELSFTFDSITNTIHLDSAQVVLEQWQNLGIDVTLKTMEIPTLLEKRVNGDYQVMFDGLSTPWADPSFYDQWFGTGGAAYAASVDFSNAEIDELLERGRQTEDTDERKRLYGEVEALLLEEAPIVWLYFRPQAEAYRAEVKGYTRIPGFGTESPFYMELDRVYLEE